MSLLQYLYQELYPSKTSRKQKVSITLLDTSHLWPGQYITIRTYNQSPLSRFLKWAFNITPPTNASTLRITRIIGKHQFEAEEVTSCSS